MPSIKAFVDHTTLVKNRRTVQKTWKLDELLRWCRLAFKTTKFRSLALTRGTSSDASFVVADQRIPDITV